MEGAPALTDEDEPRSESEVVARIDAAFRAGDLVALRAAAPEPDSVPNGFMPLAIGKCLTYAIYHSPLAFVRTLLEQGAEPNPASHDGFPPLIAALSCTRSYPGTTRRDDVVQLVELLLEFGADPNQRGVNDYTPLHMAVQERNVEALRVQLDAGAAPNLRTRIDDHESPRDLAQRGRLRELADLLARAEESK